MLEVLDFNDQHDLERLALGVFSVDRGDSIVIQI